MQLNSNRIFGVVGLGLLVGASMSTLQACDSGIPGCDLSCPTDGILEGNATITGVAEVDAFFGAVVDLSAAANSISGSLRGEIDAIGISLGLPAGSASAEIKTALEAKFTAALDGGLKIDFQPPRCEASIDVAVSAAASCDAEVDPGSATVECQGGCEVEGGVMASCEGDATLSCTGTAPNFACSGSCEGDCELEVAASCEGTCRGTCDAGCSVMDSSGNCAGECSGMCQGTCELKAGGSCGGKCTGSCTYEPGAAGCEADASAKCEAGASGSVQCDARCEGEVTPPSVKAECEATVEAKADASVECFPPSLEVTWQWSAAYEADVNAQAEFKAWLQGFKGHIGIMLAARAKADILIEALGNLETAGTAAITASGDTLANGDFVASFKLLTCGIPEIENVGGALGGATTDLQGSVSGTVDVFAAVGM